MWALLSRPSVSVHACMRGVTTHVPKARALLGRVGASLTAMSSAVPWPKLGFRWWLWLGVLFNHPIDTFATLPLIEARMLRRYGRFDVIIVGLDPFSCFSALLHPTRAVRHALHSHSTATQPHHSTAQPQHSRSTVTAQSPPCHRHVTPHVPCDMLYTATAQPHSHSTAQHSRSTVTAQSPHSHRHVTPHTPCDMLYLAPYWLPICRVKK